MKTSIFSLLVSLILAAETATAEPPNVSPALRKTFTDHQGATGVAFSPDGETLASNGEDGFVRLRVWRTPQITRTLTVKGMNRSMAFSPDGAILAIRVTEGVRLFSVKTGESLRLLESRTGGVPPVAFSSDGRLVAAGDSASTTHVWDVATGELKQTLTGTSNHLVFGVAFGPDGKWLASGAGNGVASAGDVIMWNLETGRQKWLHDDKQVWRIAATPDGREVVMLTVNGKVRFLDVETGSVRREFETGDQSRGLALSPDGRLLAATARKDITLWNTASGKPLDTLHGHDNWVLSLAFSPDGKFLASGSSDATVRVWEMPQ